VIIQKYSYMVSVLFSVTAADRMLSSELAGWNLLGGQNTLSLLLAVCPIIKQLIYWQASTITEGLSQLYDVHPSSG